MEPVGRLLRSATEGLRRAQPTRAPMLESNELLSENDVGSHYDALVREMQRIKREVRSLRSRRAVDHGLPEPINTVAVTRRIEDSVEADIRREIAIMREEFVRLQAETDGLRDLPPAYH